MTHIKTGVNQSGIVELLFYKGPTGKALSYLANTILNGPSPLSRGERELIAYHVSKQNDCAFCAASHGAVADLLLNDSGAIRKSIDAQIIHHNLRPVMPALIEIASQVQQGGKHVKEESIAKAKALGACDEMIHDTILVASAFCMYNRYVDGLATGLPVDDQDYLKSAQRIVKKGYSYPPLFLRKWIIKILNRHQNR